MKKLSTKEQLSIYANYKYMTLHYGFRRLNDCYKNCSHYKHAAERDILAEMDAINNDLSSRAYACCYAIISFNTCFFTCGYMIYTPDEHDANIEHETFIYHTACRREVIEIS